MASSEGARDTRWRPSSPKDVLAGLVFVGIGLAFAIAAVPYGLGSLTQLGSGAFPLALGLILAGLGGLIAARGLIDGEPGPIGTIPWRAVVLLVGAVVVFGLTVRSLGLVPSTFLASFLAAMASSRARPLSSAVIAAGLTAFAVVVFVFALSLRVPMFAPGILR